MRSMVSRLLLVLAALLASALLLPTHVLAQGCAMCGTAFNHDDPVARAFNWSVLFLIAMPYTVFALAAGWLFLAHRRRSGRRRADVIVLRRTPAADGPEESPT
jgi:membrane protein implicated in regulation of membrane protease activity